MNVMLPLHPFILPRPENENSGVDFLGLRQVNLDVMSLLLPGLNNVTAYIRPFSLLAWLHWKFHELWLRDGVDKPSNADLRQFRERMEILFTWGARLHDTPSIPGKTAAPSAGSPSVPVTFGAWKRVQSSTSLIAALWYGPASKTIDGLGFIEPFGSGFFRACGSGIRLAQALDGELRKNPAAYAAYLDTLTAVEADEAAAQVLWDIWGVEHTTEAEREAFRTAYFDQQSLGDYVSRIGRRSSTLGLVFHHLSGVSQSQSVEDIRRGLFLSQRPDGSVYDMPATLAMAHHRWIVLQMRQLQRLALEATMSWCEFRINDDLRDTADIVARGGKALAEADPAFAKKTLSEALSARDGQFETIAAYLSKARDDESLRPFVLMDRIREARQRGSDETAVFTVQALLLCAAFARCCADDCRKEAAMGGPGRVALNDLRRR